MKIVAATFVLTATALIVFAVTAHGDFAPISISNLDRLPKPIRAHVQIGGRVPNDRRQSGKAHRAIDAHAPASRADLVRASSGDAVVARANTLSCFYNCSSSTITSAR